MFRYFRKKKMPTAIAAVMTEFTYALDALLMRAGNGDGIIIDSSPYAYTCIPLVSPRISFKGPVVGANSCKFRSAQIDRLGVWVSQANAFGTDDYTAECWVFPRSYSTSGYINDYRDMTSQACFTDLINSAKKYCIYNAASGSNLYVSNRTIPLMAWTHIAAVRKNGVLNVYINGTLDGSIADPTNWTIPANSPPSYYLGTSSQGGGQTTANTFDGYISQVHHTKRAKYLGEFTPSKEKTTPVEDTTVLLLNFTSSDFNDVSSKTSVYGSGATKFSSSVKKFSGNSMYFDGTNYCQFDSVSLLGNFTIELWVNPSARTTAMTPLISQWWQSAGYAGWEIVLSAAGIPSFWFGAHSEAAAMLTGTAAIPLNTWTHIAVTKTYNKFYLFVNGVVVASLTGVKEGRLLDTVTVILGNCTASTGVPGGASVSYFKGCIDDVHICKDYAKYTGPFDVPTDYVTTGNQLRVSGGDPLYARTPIHLKFNDKSALAEINDGKGAVLTNSGVTFSTAQTLFYPVSAYFTGSTYITGARAHNTVKNSDFTIEGWFNFSDLTSIQYLFSFYGGSGVLAPHLAKNASNKIIFQSNYGTTDITSTTVIQANEWYHIAISRYAGVTRLFINGDMEGTPYLDSNSYTTNDASMCIGSTNAMTTIGFRGYMSDFRMTMAGRYKGPFVALAGAFPDYWDYDTDRDWSRSLTINAADSSMKLPTNKIRNKADGAALTVTGNVCQGGVSPYRDAYSVYFPAGALLRTPYHAATDLQASDFTVEFYARFDITPVNTTFVSISNQAFSIALTSSYQLTFSMGTGYGNFNIVSGSVICPYIELRRFYHIAITRSGNTVRTFVDGSLTSTVTVSGAIYSDNASGVTLGGDVSYVNVISGFRLLKGKCLYTDYFVPPKNKLTAIENTSLLLAQSKNFVDESTNNIPVTAVIGTTSYPSVSTITPFKEAYVPGLRKGSVSFDGLNDQLNTATLLKYSLGTTFEIDTWMYFRAMPISTKECRIINIGTNLQASAFVVSINYQGIVKVHVPIAGATALSSPQNTVGIGEWVHIAISVNNEIATIYKNGIAVASGQITTQTSVAAALKIGHDAVTNYNAQHNGYIADMRISNIVRHSENFVPQAGPLTVDANTLFLLQGDENVAYERNATTNIEIVGGVSHNFDTHENGSFSFDGGVSYLRVPYDAQLYPIGTGDYTVEMWCNLTTNNTVYQTMFSLGTFQLRYGNSGYSLYLQVVTGTTANYVYSANITQAFGKNNWIHIAAVRKDGIIYFYVNGEIRFIKSLANVADVQAVPSADLQLGYLSTTNGYVGMIRDFKMSNFARYCSSFVPPLRKSAQV